MIIDMWFFSAVMILMNIENFKRGDLKEGECYLVNSTSKVEKYSEKNLNAPNRTRIYDLPICI